MDNGSLGDIFGLVHDSVIACDPDGRIVAWNPAAQLLYGWSAGEAIGQSADALLQTQARDRLFHDDCWEGELRRTAADGLAITVAVRQRIHRDAGGKAIAMLEAGCAVPESIPSAAPALLERMRDDFTHAARVAMLGELTASIAHEVNQPLAAIASGGEASLRWLSHATPDIEEVRALAARIVSDARRAADIIDRVRALAQRREIVHAPLPLNAAIEDALLLLRPELRAREVRVELLLSDAAPTVHADRTQIQQLVVNLVLNAAQAMEDSPVRHVTVSTRQAGEDAVLRVEDSGPGIAPENMPRLFESFFTTRTAGMGMGLRICRSIVEAHRGRIHAENQAAGGAAFIVSLPRIG
ncbi:sensor histidine kinase [Sphingomonas sp. CJ20]